MVEAEQHAEVPGHGFTPSAFSFSLISGACSTRIKSLLNLSTIAGGVATGMGADEVLDRAEVGGEGAVTLLPLI